MKTQRTFAPFPLRFFLIVVLLLAFLPPSHTEPTNNQPTPTTSGPASLPTPSETLNPSEDLEVTFLEKKIWSLFDSRTFRARFEKYLNSPPANSAEDQKYHSTISQITLLLTPGKVNKANLDKSLELLQIASAYPGDSNLCQTLFEAIHSIRQQNLETEKLKNELRELEKERSKAEWNMQMASRQTSLSIPGGDSPAAKIAAEQAQREQTTRIQQAQKRLDEVNQTITNRKSKITINEFLAKSQLQSLAVQFFATRRFQHCILANRYYRALFSDGDNSLNAFKKNLNLPTHAYDSAPPKVEYDFNPTLSVSDSSLDAKGIRSTLMNFGLESFIGTASAAARAIAPFIQSLSQVDALAHESIREVEEAIEVVRFHTANNELKSATERLAEAFLLGEFLPPVRLLDLEVKRSIFNYLRKSQQLITALEANDFARAEQLLDELQTTASDFDPTKPRAKIQLAKVSSDILISRAKAASAQGKEEKTEESIAQALTTWHQNPELQKTASEIFNTSTDLARALTELDELLATRNLRAIYEQKGRFLTATYSDPTRASKLESALKQFAQIESALTQAQLLQKAGDPFAAWEILEKAAASTEFPNDDPIFHQLRANLAPAVANFASALQQATEAQKKSNHSSAITWFLKAQHIYPQSTLAREGLLRSLSVLFPDDPQLSPTPSK